MYFTVIEVADYKSDFKLISWGFRGCLEYNMASDAMKMHVDIRAIEISDFKYGVKFKTRDHSHC